MRAFIILVTLIFPCFAYSIESELEQAKEAAPIHITSNASYMVWESAHFVTKVQGSNGFVCLVLKDPQGRYEPSCLNQKAMKSIFPIYEYQTKLLYQGKNIDTIYKNIAEKVKAGEFILPDHGTLVYMMSPKNKFYRHRQGKLIDVPPHIMLYHPKIDSDSLGFNGKNGLPMFYDEYPHLSVIHIHTNAGLNK